MYRIVKWLVIKLKILMAPINFISKLFHYVLMGFLSVIYFIYSILYFFIFGILLKPFKKKNNFETDSSRELKKQKKESSKKKKEKDVYINEDAKFERKKFGDLINDFLKFLITLPKKTKKFLSEKYNNLTFVKNKKNKEEIHREALLISFEGEDVDKSDKKRVFEYVGRNAEGKLVKDYFEAYSKVEVHSYLLSEGYEIYSIKTSKMIQFLHGTSGRKDVNFKKKDLIFFLTQLSTYIKSGITLVESLRILSHQYKKKRYQKLFGDLIYNLTMGDNFSDALSKQGTTFPKLLINMVKTAEMTGELPEALDDMAAYYTETEKTRKQMVTAMMYPMIVLFISVVVVVFILMYVVPKFVDLFNSLDPNSIPKITLIVLAISQYLKRRWLQLLAIIALIIVIVVYLYKNVEVFRTMIQWLAMHIPVLGNIIIYNEITVFSKTFSSLLKHNVFITDSMEILTKITRNEIYKVIMLDTITNLAKGEKISASFKDHWAVPVPAYEMIVTGERTGQLAEMLEKVSEFYQDMHATAVGRLKTFIEPILIVMLTIIVGVIILSVIVPMFALYNAVGV